nr:hypothetical protein CFP56_72383 [Quercus suber]
MAQDFQRQDVTQATGQKRRSKGRTVVAGLMMVGVSLHDEQQEVQHGTGGVSFVCRCTAGYAVRSTGINSQDQCGSRSGMPSFPACAYSRRRKQAQSQKWMTPTAARHQSGKIMQTLVSNSPRLLDLNRSKRDSIPLGLPVTSLCWNAAHHREPAVQSRTV